MVKFLHLVSVIRTIIMEKIVGLWVLESRDNNYDMFLQKRGVGWFLRSIMQKFSADIEYSLSEDGKTFTKTTITSLETSVYSMRTDQVFLAEKTLSGKEEYGKLTITDDGKVIQEMKFKEDNGLAEIVERYVSDDKLYVKHQCKDIVCNEIYVRKAN